MRLPTTRTRFSKEFVKLEFAMMAPLGLPSTFCNFDSWRIWFPLRTCPGKEYARRELIYPEIRKPWSQPASPTCLLHF